MSEKGPLAAIVEKEAADEAIAGLKREGCYDRDRRIREHDRATLAVPVTREPADTRVLDVTVQDDPSRRVRQLDDYLRERGFSRDERDRAPGSWGVVGDVIVARFADCPREREVGEALLDLYGSAHTVVAREGIEGAHREPSVRVVAGRGETETLHVEDGTEYALDLRAVMFSPGNAAERRRMGRAVEPGDIVLDMFAGIGYFALPMARAGARVTAVERNHAAFEYLLENRARNEVIDRLSAIRGDCGVVVTRLATDGPIADRVVMGHFDATPYLEAAMAAVRPGGTIHLHDVGHAESPFADAERALRDTGVSVTERRIVKTHGPGTVHVVVEGTAIGADN